MPAVIWGRRVLAAIHEPGAFARVLLAMGLASAVRGQAGCRSSPATGRVATTLPLQTAFYCALPQAPA